MHDKIATSQPNWKQKSRQNNIIRNVLSITTENFTNIEKFKIKVVTAKILYTWRLYVFDLTHRRNAINR